MNIFNLVVLCVIIAPNNVLTPHISKTYLPIVLLMYLQSNWINAPKTSQGKKVPVPRVGGWNSISSKQSLNIY